MEGCRTITVSVDIMRGGYYHTTFKREYEAKFNLGLGLWVVKKEWKEIKRDIYAKYPYLKRRKDVRFIPNDVNKSIWQNN